MQGGTGISWEMAGMGPSASRRQSTKRSVQMCRQKSDKGKGRHEIRSDASVHKPSPSTLSGILDHAVGAAVGVRPVLIRARGACIQLAVCIAGPPAWHVVHRNAQNVPSHRCTADRTEQYRVHSCFAGATRDMF